MFVVFPTERSCLHDAQAEVHHVISSSQICDVWSVVSFAQSCMLWCMLLHGTATSDSD